MSKVQRVLQQHSDKWGAIMAHEPWVDFAIELLEAVKEELGQPGPRGYECESVDARLERLINEIK